MSKKPHPDNEVQGEGDYKAARRYRQHLEKTLANIDLEKAAREAEPRNSTEAREMADAEAEGKRHAKPSRRR